MLQILCSAMNNIGKAFEQKKKEKIQVLDNATQNQLINDPNGNHSKFYLLNL